MFQKIKFLLRLGNQSASSEKGQGDDEARARMDDIPNQFH